MYETKEGAGIAQSVQAGRPGFDSQQGRDIFFYSTASRRTLGPTQPIQWVPWALSSAVKWPGHEADYSPLFRAGVTNGGAAPPLPDRCSWRVA
jgi:hypothetical protein